MCNLHWCYTSCTDVTLFALVLHLNCTALSQSESSTSNFFWNHTRDFKIERARSASSIWNHKYDFRPKCKDVMDRTMIAYDCALIFESYRAGSRHEWMCCYHRDITLQGRNHITLLCLRSVTNGESRYIFLFIGQKMLRTTVLSFVYNPTVRLSEHMSTFGKIVKLIFLSLHSPCSKPVFGGCD